MAVYSVKSKKSGDVRLIETRTKVSAINHVAGSDYEAKALNTRELVQFIQSGLSVETLKPEDAAEETKAVSKEATKNPPAATKAAVTGQAKAADKK